jgi:porin
MSFLRLFIISLSIAEFISAQIKPEISYTGEVVNNTYGGLKKGTSYQGLVNFKFTYNTESTGLWKGGEVYLNIANTHGGTPAQTLFGDYQGLSNIEAGNHTYIHEFWYRQSLHDVDITLGLQDLNASFIISENGTNFINSSFGVPACISHNCPVPIFPLTTPGAAIRWRITESFTAQTAIYDGNNSGFEKDPHNLNWSISKDDGYLSISELQFQHPANFDLGGIYKAGFYYHNTLRQENEDIEPVTVFNNRYGFYFNTDNEIVRVKGSVLNAFTQLSVSHGWNVENNLYIGGGLLFKQVFADNDALGAAYAGSYFNDGRTSEKVLELTYKGYITESVFIQPDIQYIINPAGDFSSMQNALAGIIRFGCNY